MLVDCHLHLQLEPLCNEIAEVVSQASQAGVGELWCCGTSEKDFQAVIVIADNYENIRPFIGVHPCLVNECSENWKDKFIELLETHPDVQVGEIGLDRWLKDWQATADLQEDAFRFQMAAAKKYGRVVEIHFRRAVGWLIDVLRSCDLPERFILHSYAGPVEMIDEFAAMGAYFTFSGTLLGLSRKKVHEAAVSVPQNRLLIETDSPDLPIPGCGRPNYPKFLPVVFEELARRRGLEKTELEEILYRNSRDFLGLT